MTVNCWNGLKIKNLCQVNFKKMSMAEIADQIWTIGKKSFDWMKNKAVGSRWI